MSEHAPRLSIVVVSWNTVDLLRACLGSLRAVADEVPCETIVVDNASADGSADMVAIARGMMYDPRWAWHAAEALGEETAYAPQYARGHPKHRPELFPQRRAAE